MKIKTYKICLKLNHQESAPAHQEKMNRLIEFLHQEMKEGGYQEASETDKTIDVVFSVGGDGTMLHTMRQFLKKKAKVVGIHAGNLGFLTPYTMDQILSGHPVELVENQPRIEKRSILMHKMKGPSGVKRREHSGNAVNEYAITGKEPSDMLSFSVIVEHRGLKSHAGHYRANGVILSGPCGSTAYNMNAGGAIVDPVVKCMQMLLLAPTTLGNRPMIISKNSKVYIQVDQEAQVYADGQSIGLWPAGSTFVGGLMRQESEIIVPDDWNFFSVLSKKLHWNNGKDVNDR